MPHIPHSADNKKYQYTHTAPIGCNDCNGCDKCCHEMGDSIIQDPYDMWNFCSHMKLADGNPVSFDILISDDGPWELSMHSNMLLPNLKMVDDGHCSFLTNSGRCGIHSIRSGLCRLYPLGRYYEQQSASNSESTSETLSYYILDASLGCPKIANSGSNVRISDWLSIPEYDKYERFLLDWHSVKNDMSHINQIAGAKTMDDLRELLLQIFYAKAYSDDFYSDFDSRLIMWKNVISQLTK